MDTLLILVIIFTFILGVISILYLLFQVRKRKQYFVKYLLFVLLFLNSMWYSVLFLQLLESGVILLKNRALYLGLEILFSSLLFYCRFFFLIAFIQMVVKILDYKFSKTSILAIKITAIAIIVIWLFGWLEFLMFDSREIANNFLIYSDVLIFFSIIIASVFLISQTKHIQDKPSQKSIKLLGIIFIIPIVLGFFKWLISSSIEDNNIERLSIHIMVILFNVIIIWWVVFYSGGIIEDGLFKKEEIKSSLNKLISKYNISKREMDVILLICEGATNKVIAEKLFISIDTVKDHNSRIFQKTGVKNRTQLAKLFIK